jgi:hypothetical protein
LKETGARGRAATPSERRKPRHSISRKVFERAEPVMSRRRQQTAAWNGTAAGPLRGIGGGTMPYPAAWSGKERCYKAGWPKSSGAGRESEGSKVPGKACKKTRWREGGTCSREFLKMDRFVYSRLVRWLYRRDGQRKTRRCIWTAEQFWAMGLYRLRGTVKYPAQATPGRSSLSRVRENRTHGLKGGC